MSAEHRRLWGVRRVDGGVVPPGVGAALVERLARAWPAVVRRIARLSADAMAGEPAQMVARAGQLVQARALQLMLLGDGLHGVYSALRAAPADAVRRLLAVEQAGDDEDEPVEDVALDGGHSHAEAAELAADALLRERAAAEEARSPRMVCAHDGCECIKLLHAHTMRQALLVDALRAQIAAAMTDGQPDRRRACAVAVRA